MRACINMATWHYLPVLLCYCMLMKHGGTIAATKAPAPLPNATERANITIKGLFRYYWSSDPNDPDAKFFFVCGQVGGGGGNLWNKCGCSDPTVCLECYRWYDAVQLESVATYGIYTGTKMFNDSADHIYNHSPYNAKWNAITGCTFMDDFTWYGIAYLRVYEWLKEPKWLQRSLALYNWVWHYGWDEPCGGFWWNNCEFSKYKDSITIVENLYFSAKLAFMFPGQPLYLERALKVWDWIFSFDNGRGLMSDQNLMSTGAVPERCCNATHNDTFTKCQNSKMPGTSYNQGILMSGSAYLYRVTGNKKYLNTGLNILQAILENYTTSDGVFLDEPRSYSTWQAAERCTGIPSDPGGDFYSFQGIFMMHLGYFLDILVPVNAIPFYALQDIARLVDITSNAAWTKSARWPPFNTSMDACNINGLSTRVGLPKFHWWWNNEVKLSQQQIPPDIRHFFQKVQLRCTALKKGGELWAGIANTGVNCTFQCQINPNCSKFEYKGYNGDKTEHTDASAAAKFDCWHWSYDRTTHICNTNIYGFQVGIRRPVGNATCAGKCNSKEPQQLYQGGVCYCDSECTKHLDCCLDYGAQCLPPEPVTCRGLCNVEEPRAIPWGGYCWCSAGCTGGFTDNNSYGSCCPDYGEVCLKNPIPPCLDSRSHASALGLFLAHIRVSQLKIL